MTAWPDTAQRWRDATALFGAVDWDTGVMHAAAVLDAEDIGPRSADVPAALGDIDATRRLGEDGLVALRAAGAIFEVQETVDGWELVANPGTPDVPGLAMAAVMRAARLVAERRQSQGRR